jgi:crotonobetainyl-CoA:carnitine CoA-transferase CaiB-like acyl-CoA transferase
MLDYQVNGRRTRRPDFPPGNRSVFPALAPHNTYRCAGKDRVGQDWWVFIACETQTQFEALCEVMEQPGLARDPRFATNDARVLHQDELDAIIGKWTRARRRYDIMRRCQAAGIGAAVVQSAEDRVDSDHRPSGSRRGVSLRSVSGAHVPHASEQPGPCAGARRAQSIRLR